MRAGVVAICMAAERACKPLVPEPVFVQDANSGTATNTVAILAK